jgi:hypothetical protein
MSIMMFWYTILAYAGSLVQSDIAILSQSPEYSSMLSKLGFE